MNRESVDTWLQRYIEAWKTYDPQAIGDLFSEDAGYRFHPWDEPIKGREAIVANWLKSPDSPGSWRADYEAFAVDGDRAVAIGTTDYFGEDGTTVDKGYYNVWLLHFDGDGKCSDFIETYMEMPAK